MKPNRNCRLCSCFTSSGAEPLLHLDEELAVGSEHIAGYHRVGAAIDVDHAAAGLADDEYAGGEIPGFEAAFPEGIEAAGGHIGKVETGGAGAAQAADMALKHGKFAIEPLEGIRGLVRQAAAQKRVLELTAGGEAK